ncbi:MAG: hypothetical protein CVT60_04845 [Actinobacteria bacterium HGW-Actinobacteria-10]|nr:MAG: hypothetical protein CVT60_04845 [Actinobacteria bacterium HGW-Actinobacteria-10]
MTDEVCAVEPRVFDTYALVYAFTLLFLVPGSILIGTLPFRTYTVSYLSLVALPFVLGPLLVFLTDCSDSLKDKLIRFAVLMPIIIITGISVVFVSAIGLAPVSDFIKPGNFGVLTWISVVSLVIVALPLLPALFTRLRSLTSVRSAVQAAVIAAAIGVVAVVVWLTLSTPGTLADLARKDVIIYIVGGVTWYLPGFGLAAGIWRRVGLI